MNETITFLAGWLVGIITGSILCFLLLKYMIKKSAD